MHLKSSYLIGREIDIVEWQPYNPYMDLTDGEGFQFKGWERIYDESFLGYFNLLASRCDRLQQLDVDSLDRITYRDMCLVMIRALLIESKNRTENYTLQNFLLRHGQASLANEVNGYLNQSINSLMTLRDALKLIVDKFIAHNDSIVEFDAEFNDNNLSDIFFKRLLFLSDINVSSYPFTIERIVEFIREMVNKISLPSDISQNGFMN